MKTGSGLSSQVIVSPPHPRGQPFTERLFPALPLGSPEGSLTACINAASETLLMYAQFGMYQNVTLAWTSKLSPWQD